MRDRQNRREKYCMQTDALHQRGVFCMQRNDLPHHPFRSSCLMPPYHRDEMTAECAPIDLLARPPSHRPVAAECLCVRAHLRERYCTMEV